MLECPRCGARQPLLSLRTEFHCHRCGTKIRSNAMSLGIIGLAFASVPTFLLPSSGWSLTGELLAYLAIALVVVVLLVPFVHLTEST